MARRDGQRELRRVIDELLASMDADPMLSRNPEEYLAVALASQEVQEAIQKHARVAWLFRAA